MEKLFSPWRLRYIRSARRPASGCVFCAARRARPGPRSLVLARGRSNYVILNKYPYNNGHLMVVPNAHQASLVDLDPATLAHLNVLKRQRQSMNRALLKRRRRKSGQ